MILLLILLLAAPASAAPIEYVIEFTVLSPVGVGGTGTFTLDDAHPDFGRAGAAIPVTSLHVEMLNRIFTEAGYSGDYLLDGSPWHFGGFGFPVALYHVGPEPSLELKTISPLDVVLSPIGFVPAKALTLGPATVGDPHYPSVDRQHFGAAPSRWFIWSSAPTNDTSTFGTYTIQQQAALLSASRSMAPSENVPGPGALVLLIVGAGLVALRCKR